MNQSARRDPVLIVFASLFLTWCLVQIVMLTVSALMGPDPRLLSYFSADVIERHREYLRPYGIKYWIDQVVGLVIVGLFLGARLNARLYAACERWTQRAAQRPGILGRVGAVLSKLWGDDSWSAAMLFVAVYLAIIQIIGLPEHFYFTWWRDRQHGISVESLGHWIWDEAKGFSLGVAVLASLCFGLYGLARRLNRWWLVLGIPCALGLMGAGIFDPLRVSIYHDFVRVPDGPVRDAVTAVLAKAKVEYEDVYALEIKNVTKRVNAEIIGQGPTRRIVLWDTFIDAMTPDEVANGVAHELGHLRDRGPGGLMMAALVFVPALYLLSRFLRSMGRTGRFGFDGDRDVRSLPAVMFFWWMLTQLTAPVSAYRSRGDERRADAYALQLVQQPEAFRSMMVKLARVNLADIDPPLWSYQGHSHPRVLDRLQEAERFAREHGIALADPKPELFSVPESALPTASESVKASARAGP